MVSYHKIFPQTSNKYSRIGVEEYSGFLCWQIPSTSEQNAACEKITSAYRAWHLNGSNLPDRFQTRVITSADRTFMNEPYVKRNHASAKFLRLDGEQTNNPLNFGAA